VAARVTATLLGVSMFSAIFVRLIAVQQRTLEARAVSDALTGLHSRTLLPTTLEQAMEQSRRTGIPMTLLAFDLDEFKEINDRHGHDAGDAVLRAVADILRARIRRSDRAFRLGGEEFLAFLYGTDKQQGLQLAEELRSAVESKLLVPHRAVTVSVGMAAYSGDPDWETWETRCDQNLYDAKAKGRNLVVGCRSPHAPSGFPPTDPRGLDDRARVTPGPRPTSRYGLSSTVSGAAPPAWRDRRRDAA